MTRINTVHDFTQSRFSICAVLSLICLYFAFFSQELFSFEITDAISINSNLIGFIVFVMLLSSALSGVNGFSFWYGFSVVIGSILSLGLLIEKFSEFSVLLVFYTGLYIMLNRYEKDFNMPRHLICFFFSRFFIGFCSAVFGLVVLSDVKILIDNAMQWDSIICFGIGNAFIMLGLIMMFVKRKNTSFSVGLVLSWVYAILFSVLILFWLPAVLLLANDKGVNYEYTLLTGFHWVLAILLIYSSVIFLIYKTDLNKRIYLS